MHWFEDFAVAVELWPLLREHFYVCQFKNNNSIIINYSKEQCSNPRSLTSNHRQRFHLTMSPRCHSLLQIGWPVWPWVLAFYSSSVWCRNFYSLACKLSVRYAFPGPHIAVIHPSTPLNHSIADRNRLASVRRCSEIIKQIWNQINSESSIMWAVSFLLVLSQEISLIINTHDTIGMK